MLKPGVTVSIAQRHCSTKMQQHQYILSSLLLAASAIHAQTTTLNDIFAPPDSSNSRTDLFTPTSTGSDFSSSTASPSVSGTPATVYFVALEGTAVSIDPDVELLASVIAAEPSATTYHIAEIIGGPNVQYPIMTIVNGPSTYVSLASFLFPLTPVYL